MRFGGVRAARRVAGERRGAYCGWFRPGRQSRAGANKRCESFARWPLDGPGGPRRGGRAEPNDASTVSARVEAKEAARETRSPTRSSRSATEKGRMHGEHVRHRAGLGPGERVRRRGRTVGDVCPLEGVVQRKLHLDELALATPSHPPTRRRAESHTNQRKRGQALARTTSRRATGRRALRSGTSCCSWSCARCQRLRAARWRPAAAAARATPCATSRRGSAPRTWPTRSCRRRSRPCVRRSPRGTTWVRAVGQGVRTVAARAYVMTTHWFWPKLRSSCIAAVAVA